MSRPTPDDEYAGGMLSFFSQVPVANWKKLEHARTVVSTIAGSTTFTGASRVAGCCARAPAAPSADEATSAAASARRRVEIGFGIDVLRVREQAWWGRMEANVARESGRVN